MDEMQVRYKKAVGGYFTVEAALVLPIVFGCYFVVVMSLIFIYERCIWEQNACRLPIWREYVEGYWSGDPGREDELSEEELGKYLLQYLGREEKHRYLTSCSVGTKLKIRGEKCFIEREVTYLRRPEYKFTFRVDIFCPKEVNYIRTLRVGKTNNKVGEGKK